ncbi:unnamed protein product [Rodentolepis nana]|uniref:MARVEL domain-containing protein n=1 Tax=Rodentolepis nana TaxID=102285 RepID=A0A0R3T2C5_RODNA|nr:unnamed protein product [Rodentolepis nana]
MNRNIGFGPIACLVLLLLVLSLGVPRWPCASYILGKRCTQYHTLKVVGILLATASVATLLVGIFLLFVILQGSSRMFNASLMAAGITALLTTAATFYNANSNPLWCPAVSTFASGIALGLFSTFLFDHLSKRSPS